MPAAKKSRGRRVKKKRPALKFSKVAVVALLVSVAAFTIAMITVYIKTGGIPDTLVASFFAFAGGEAGFLGLIKHSDNKYGGDSQSASVDPDENGVG